MRRVRSNLRHVALALLLATPALAATSPNIGPGTTDGDIGEASLGAPRNDMPVQTAKAAPKPLVSANPLWAIPLSTLTATRERPLFSPSRRPPKPVVANAPAIPRPQPRPPVVAEHPDLILVGTVTGETQSVAVFIDPATHGTIRLRTGENHKGWTLRSVEAKSVTLHKGNTTETLALPLPSGTAGSKPIVSALPPAPPPPPPMAAQPVGAIGPEGPVPQQQGCMPEPIGC
jgi:hypothetical protein